jgi:hypothetical protein
MIHARSIWWAFFKFPEPAQSTAVRPFARCSHRSMAMTANSTDLRFRTRPSDSDRDSDCVITNQLCRFDRQRQATQWPARRCRIWFRLLPPGTCPFFPPGFGPSPADLQVHYWKNIQVSNNLKPIYYVTATVTASRVLSGLRLGARLARGLGQPSPLVDGSACHMTQIA